MEGNPEEVTAEQNKVPGVKTKIRIEAMTSPRQLQN
jgi:hypothetical protein